MLYTRKGDNGSTGFFGTKRRFSKNSLRVEALGSLDELNSLIGVCKTISKKRTITKILDDVQEDLFIIQAEIAVHYAPKGVTTKKLSKNKIGEIEKVIDGLEAKISRITTFSVPGGCELSAYVDYARAVSRRVERVVIALGKKESVSTPILQYMNRLSSLLFALARYANKLYGVREKAPRY